MEALRSGYKTMIRFYGNSQDATEVVWFPVPEDRPWIPFAHIFGSGEWEADGWGVNREVGWYGLGEQMDAARVRPTRYTDRRTVFRGQFCGSVGSWQNGDGLPVVPPPAQADGYPVCCGPARIPLPNWPDCAVLYAQAKALRLLWEATEGDQAAFTAAVNALFDGPFELHYANLDARGQVPQFAILSNGDWVLIFIQGTRTVTQWLAQIVQPGDMTTGNCGNGKNYLTARIYDFLARNIEALANNIPGSTDPRTPWVIAGHSLGGAVANILAIRASNARVARPVYVSTFGSPRCFDGLGTINVYRNVNNHYINVANTGDVVPLVPPHVPAPLRFTLPGSLVALLSNATWSNLPAWFLVDEQGRFSESQQGEATLPLLRMLAALVSDRVPFAVPITHSIYEYERRLSTLRCREVPPAPSPTPQGPDLWLRPAELPESAFVPLWAPGPGTAVSLAWATGNVPFTDGSVEFPGLEFVSNVGHPLPTKPVCALQPPAAFNADFALYVVAVSESDSDRPPLLLLSSSVLVPGGFTFSINAGGWAFSWPAHGIAFGGRPFYQDRIAAFSIRRTAGVFEVWHNGALVRRFAGYAGAFMLGQVTTGPGAGPDGECKLVELMGFNRAVSAAEDLSIWDYLSHYWRDTVQPGSIVCMPLNGVYDDLLPCDGAQYLKSDFPFLYGVVGDAFANFRGAAPPDADKFRVPDYRGLVLLGGGAAGINPATSDRSVVNTGGEQAHALTTPELASHTHGVFQTDHTHSPGGSADNYVVDSGGPGVYDAGANGGLAESTGNGSANVTILPEGADGAHNNMQPFSVAFYFIAT